MKEAPKMGISATSAAYSETLALGRPALFTLDTIDTSTLPGDLFAYSAAGGGTVITFDPLPIIGRAVEPGEIVLCVGDCHTVAGFMEKYEVRQG